MREAIVRFVMRILGMLATGNVRGLVTLMLGLALVGGLVTLMLGLALVGGLWETSLYNLSARDTATAVMTEVGVELINPVLENNSLGLSKTLYASLLTQAKANPAQPLTIPGLKVQVMGREIASKSFDVGSRVIYAKVAAGYYDGGWAAVLAVPDSLTKALGTLALLPQAVASQGAKQVGAPQLPSVPLPPLGAVGLSLQTFTAAGHAQVLALDKWLVGIVLLCLLLLALAGKRWQRLSAPAWALVTGALPGAFGIGAVAFFWARNASLFQPFSGLLHALARAFVPVYGGALAAGVAALVVAWVGDMATHAVDMRQAAADRARVEAERQAAFHAPAPKYRPPAAASGIQGYSDWGYQDRRPAAGQGGPGSAGVHGRGGGSSYAPGRPVPAPRGGPAGGAGTPWQPATANPGWSPASGSPYSGPTWSLGPSAPPPPNSEHPAWAPPDDPRPPYAGPSWANEPPDDPWSRDAQGGQPPAMPPWGAPPSRPARAPYGHPGGPGGGPGVGLPPSGGRDPRGQGVGRDGSDWGSDADDDPWAPRGR